MKNAILKVAYCAMATAMFAACSTDDFAERNAIGGQISGESSQASEVLVKLGAGAPSAEVSPEDITSKGIINSNDDKAFATEDLSIFMLAKRLSPDNPYNGLKDADINWSKHDQTVKLSYLNVDAVDNWSAPIWNSPAVAKMRKADGTPTTKLDEAKSSYIDFKNGNNYYPIGNYCSYEFYGYAPYQSLTEKNSTVTKNSLTVNMTATGKEDVIWGCARYVKGNEDGSVDGTAIKFNPDPLPITYDDGTIVNDYEPYAYSAKFFRFAAFRTPAVTDGQGNVISGDEPLAPTMKFKHKMIMFKFNVIAGGTALDDAVADKNYARAYKTKVKNIRIDNAPKTFSLVVADNRSTGNQRGKIINIAGSQSLLVAGEATPVPGTDGKPVAVPVKNADGDSYILLPTKPATDATYLLKLTLVDYNDDPNGKEQELGVPYVLALKEGTQFEEGYIYNVTLKVWNMEKIQLEATCEKWKEMDSTDTQYPFITENDGTIPVY